MHKRQLVEGQQFYPTGSTNIMSNVTRSMQLWTSYNSHVNTGMRYIMTVQTGNTLTVGATMFKAAEQSASADDALS